MKFRKSNFPKDRQQVTRRTRIQTQIFPILACWIFTDFLNNQLTSLHIAHFMDPKGKVGKTNNKNNLLNPLPGTMCYMQSRTTSQGENSEEWHNGPMKSTNPKWGPHIQEKRLFPSWHRMEKTCCLQICLANSQLWMNIFSMKP